MITADRFLVRETDHDEWVARREQGVTATMVRDGATEAGFRDLVASWSLPRFEGNAYTEFGSWAEPQIMRYAHAEFGVLPSDWLIRSEADPRWLATPDGLTVDHTVIAEAKTTGTDWTKVPVKYARQVQWQLMVTGAERCLFLWHLRAQADDGSFYLPWLEPKTRWIERDEDMIADLVKVAEKIWEAKHGELRP